MYFKTNYYLRKQLKTHNFNLEIRIPISNKQDEVSNYSRENHNFNLNNKAAADYDEKKC